MDTGLEPVQNPLLEAMFKVGAHFGYGRSRRHPSAVPFIFGIKNRVEIFDLEKTIEALAIAKAVTASFAKAGKTVLFVGGKSEASDAVKLGALTVGMPYVSGRWIGGTLSNFANIRARVDMLLDLTSKREKGELYKYTKKERLLIDRKIDKLEVMFRGLVPLTALPQALFVIDPKKEHNAVAEAKKVGIPVIALASSDCDMKGIEYAIPANDGLMSSIKFFVDEIVAAYREGKGALSETTTK